MWATEEAFEDPEVTIELIWVGQTTDEDFVERERMEESIVGAREYSAFVWGVEDAEGNPGEVVVYLAGGKWWKIVFSSYSEVWTDRNDELVQNFLASIDHG